jgi:hypothetical protein
MDTSDLHVAQRVTDYSKSDLTSCRPTTAANLAQQMLTAHKTWQLKHPDATNIRFSRWWVVAGSGQQNALQDAVMPGNKVAS